MKPGRVAVVCAGLLLSAACSSRSESDTDAARAGSGASDGGGTAAVGGAGEAGQGAAGSAGRSGTGSAGGAAASTGGRGGSDAGSGGSEAGSIASAGAGAGAADAGSPSCLQADYARPELDKSCTTAADCFVAFHMADCCRSLIGLAFSQSEQAAFEAYESSCGLPCTCPAMQPMAEDGSPLLTSEMPIAECASGACIARGSDPAQCDGMLECTDPENGGTCVVATGQQGNGFCRGSDGVCQRCRCAAPDTPIATPEGERPIAALRPGDLVYSIDDEGIRVVPIARISRTPAVHHQVVHVLLASGRTLEISPGHPTADGRSFADLHEADQLGDIEVIEARRVHYAHAFTYDILPASSTGTYFAAGVPIGSTLF